MFSAELKNRRISLKFLDAELKSCHAIHCNIKALDRDNLFLDMNYLLNAS